MALRNCSSGLGLGANMSQVSVMPIQRIYGAVRSRKIRAGQMSIGMANRKIAAIWKLTKATTNHRFHVPFSISAGTPLSLPRFARTARTLAVFTCFLESEYYDPRLHRLYCSAATDLQTNGGA